jgi:hypothetical protein
MSSMNVEFIDENGGGRRGAATDAAEEERLDTGAFPNVQTI